MLVKTQNLIEAARHNRYAIGCFLAYDLETALAIARAAVEMKAPIIMAVSESTIAFAGIGPISRLVEAIADTTGSVPVAFHLDHGKSFDAVKACVGAGFTSVQIDGSALGFADNVHLTKETADYCHSHGLCVEGELGVIQGGHGQTGTFAGEIPLVDPFEVKEFVSRTGVDLLAAAVGTVHGEFTNERIHFDLLKKIMRLTSVPLVLHGASGLPDEQIVQAVAAGICKVNFGTEIKQTFVESLRATLKDGAAIAGVRELMTPAMTAVAEVVKHSITLLGSANRIA